MNQLKSPNGRVRECRQQKFPKKARLNKHLASVLKILILTDESKRTKTETVLYKFYIEIFLGGSKNEEIYFCRCRCCWFVWRLCL